MTMARARSESWRQSDPDVHLVCEVSLKKRCLNVHVMNVQVVHQCEQQDQPRRRYLGSRRERDRDRDGDRDRDRDRDRDLYLYLYLYLYLHLYLYLFRAWNPNIFVEADLAARTGVQPGHSSHGR